MLPKRSNGIEHFIVFLLLLAILYMCNIYAYMCNGESLKRIRQENVLY